MSLEISNSFFSTLYKHEQETKAETLKSFENNLTNILKFLFTLIFDEEN